MSSDRLAVKICRLFYEENLTKIEIEKRLHISRFKVARILKEAKRSGLIRIQIMEPETDLSELEKELEKIYKLKSAVLVWDDGDTLNQLKKRAGLVASQYVLGILRPEDILGVGWGTTTYELVNAMPENIALNPTVVQVSGGNVAIESGIDSQALTLKLARKFGVEPFLLHAPTFVDRIETRKLLLKEKSFKKIFQLYSKTNVLIAGIGAFIGNSFIGSRYLDPTEMAALNRQKAVGEYLTYCYDIHGRICETEALERTIAIPAEMIKSIPCSIGIAVGKQKSAAIKGAVRAGLINTLITDTTTAKSLINSRKEAEHE